MESSKQITFQSVDSNGSVKMELIDSITWPELTNQFVSFMQACGYIVNGYELGEYLINEYGFQKEKEETTEWSPQSIIAKKPKEKKRKK